MSRDWVEGGDVAVTDGERNDCDGCGGRGMGEGEARDRPLEKVCADGNSTVTSIEGDVMPSPKCVGLVYTLCLKLTRLLVASE